MRIKTTGQWASAAALAAAGGLAATPVAEAADGTWTQLTGSNASGSWNTAGNWAGSNIADGSGFTADFSTLDVGGTSTITLDAPRTIGNIVFGNTDTSTAGSWILNAGTGSPVLTLAGTTPTITVNPLGSGSSARINAIIGGSDGLTKAGSGLLILAGNNTFTGTTTISAGTLRLGADSTTGSVSGNIVNNAALQVQRGNAITLAGDITGTGSLQKLNSAGTLTLTGNNTYAGGTTITDGGILLGTGTNNGIGTGTLTIGRGRLGSSDNNARTISNTLNINISGNLTFGASQGAATGLGDLTFTDATSGNGPGGGTSIAVHNATTVTLHKQLAGGGVQITKSGTGTLVLNGANMTYGGGTTVNAGTLLINGGKNGGGAVTVNAGGALGGTGEVHGATTFADDSIFLASIAGELDFDDLVTLADGALIATDDVLTLASYTVLTHDVGELVGTFTVDSSITSQGYSVVYGDTSVTLVVPEPAALALMGLGGLAIAGRRRG